MNEGSEQFHFGTQYQAEEGHKQTEWLLDSLALVVSGNSV